MGTILKRYVGNVKGPKGQDGKAFDIYNLGAFDEYVANGDGTATITRKTGVVYISPDLNMSFTAQSKYSQYPYFVLGGDTEHMSVKHLQGGVTHKCNTLPYISSLAENKNLIYLISTEGQNTLVLRIPSCVKYDADGNASAGDSIKAMRQWLSINPTYICGLMKSEYWYEEIVALNQPLSLLSQCGETWASDEWRKGLNLFDITNDLTSRATKGATDYEFTNTGGATQPFAVVRVKAGKTYTISFMGEYTSTSKDALFLGVMDGENTAYWVKNEETGEYAANTDNICYTPDGKKALLVGISATLSEVKGITFVAKSDYISLCSLSTKIQHIMLTEGNILYPCEPYRGGIVREKEFNALLARVADLETRLAGTETTE